MALTVDRMRPRDAEPAADVVRAGGWGDRSAFFGFAARHAACDAFVARVDGELAATGVGTANGPVGWIGAIFVAEPFRRRGIGGAITTAVIDALEARGCRTLVLVASDDGRRLYEPLGFRVATHYHTYEAPRLPGAAVDPRVRQFRRSDLEALIELDAGATGEDRGHLLRAFASRATTTVVVDAADRPAGFVARSPWGGGATIARDPAAAFRLLEARRASPSGTGRIRAGVLSENMDGRARLEAAGWTEAWAAPRMTRGPALDWNPRAIWGQYNFAVG